MGPVLFSLALFARALITAVTGHWVIVGLSFLMGEDLDDVGTATSILVVLLVLTVLGSIITIRRRQPGGKERMAAGPQSITQWRPLVFTVGAASALGGLCLYVAASPQAGLWAMGIGMAMVVFELAAIVGAAILENDSIDPAAE
jgi:hypothetical protein